MLNGMGRKGVSRTASLGRQAVQGVVALAHGTDLAAEREGSGGGECATIGIDVGNADLNRGMVLGGDKAVWDSRESVRCPLHVVSRGGWVLTGRRALAGDVEVNKDTL